MVVTNVVCVCRVVAVFRP